MRHIETNIAYTRRLLILSFIRGRVWGGVAALIEQAVYAMQSCYKIDVP